MSEVAPRWSVAALVGGLLQWSAYAATLATVLWLLVSLPIPAGAVRPLLLVAKVLDLPVAVTGRILPEAWRGIDLFTNNHDLETGTPAFLLRHLCVAVPAYLGSFYLLSFAVASAKRWRSRAQRQASP